MRTIALPERAYNFLHDTIAAKHVNKEEILAAARIGVRSDKVLLFDDIEFVVGHSSDGEDT